MTQRTSYGSLWKVAVMGISKVLCHCSLLASAQDFSQGANCLFAGHSFFIPVAQRFDAFALTMTQQFPNHVAQGVFSGGQSGSPIALWENKGKRDDIDAFLSTGEIDLFGLTVFSDVTSPDELVTAYQNWFDLAISYNPDTAFFVGVPWVPGGSTSTTALFAVQNSLAGQLTFQAVTTLRELYPDNSIHMLNYGLAVSRMKAMWDDGELVGPTELVGDSNVGLFTDNNLGHGGDMILDMSGLLWLNWLYGASYDELVSDGSQLGYEMSNVEDILETALAGNEFYRLATSESTPTTPIDTGESPSPAPPPDSPTVSGPTSIGFSPTDSPSTASPGGGSSASYAVQVVIALLSSVLCASGLATERILG